LRAVASVGRFELLLKHGDNGIVPGVMEIFLCRRDIDLLARAAAIRVGRQV
jgi:hypothetical protein